MLLAHHWMLSVTRSPQRGLVGWSLSLKKQKRLKYGFFVRRQRFAFSGRAPGRGGPQIFFFGLWGVYSV